MVDRPRRSRPPAPSGEGDGEPACRRGSVHRPLAGIRMGDHPSVRPTWECPRTGRPLPVRPCSGWGLPSRPGRPGRWCALTAPFHPHLCPDSLRKPKPSAVCSLWHFPAGRPDWPLASILPCGAPTFLSEAPGGGRRRGHPAGSPSPPVWRARGPGATEIPFPRFRDESFPEGIGTCNVRVPRLALRRRCRLPEPPPPLCSRPSAETVAATRRCPGRTGAHAGASKPRSSTRTPTTRWARTGHWPCAEAVTCGSTASNTLSRCGSTPVSGVVRPSVTVDASCVGAAVRPEGPPRWDSRASADGRAC